MVVVETECLHLIVMVVVVVAQEEEAMVQTMQKIKKQMDRFDWMTVKKKT